MKQTKSEAQLALEKVQRERRKKFDAFQTLDKQAKEAEEAWQQTWETELFCELQAGFEEYAEIEEKIISLVYTLRCYCYTDKKDKATPEQTALLSKLEIKYAEELAVVKKQLEQESEKRLAKQQKQLLSYSHETVPNRQQ